MITTNENNWNDDLNNQNQANGSNSFGTPDNGDTTNRNFSEDIEDNSGIDRDSLSGDDTAGNIPGSYSSNESFSGANSPDDDDDLALDDDDDIATGDDIDVDDDLIDTDDDLDEDYDETDLDDTEGGGTTTTGAYTTGLGDSGNPDEIPEESESNNEGTGYDNQTEVERQQGSGSDASYSEQTDVTPPNDHGFPAAAGSPKTDFTSRPQGRTTGRMVGHEPGTEGI
jgi:hypothetical protein